MVNSTGALLMNKRTFLSLSQKSQAIVSRLAKLYCAKLVQLTRRDNVEALQVLEEAGVQRISPSAEQIAAFEQSANKNYQMSIPSLYSRELFQQIRGLIVKYRTVEADSRKSETRN